MRANCEGERKARDIDQRSVDVEAKEGIEVRGGTVIIKCIREIFRNERVSPPIDESDSAISSPAIFGKHGRVFQQASQSEFKEYLGYKIVEAKDIDRPNIPGILSFFFSFFVSTSRARRKEVTREC